MRRWLRRARAAHADRLFRARLQLAAGDEQLMWSLSPERRDYVTISLRAMDWWIGSGRAGEIPPRSRALRDDAPDRDLIIVAYLRAHRDDEDLGRAFRAIRAQSHHLARAC